MRDGESEARKRVEDVKLLIQNYLDEAFSLTIRTKSEENEKVGEKERKADKKYNTFLY